AASPVVASLRSALRDAANPSGGWPYYTAKISRIEPTCWALLALHSAWEDHLASWSAFAAPHLRWLARRQRRDGLLVDGDAMPPNFTANGLALCSLAQFEATHSATSIQLVDALVAAKGVSVDDKDPRQDNRLQGWPWMPDTFSWLEPTCWCVLGLKKA